MATIEIKTPAISMLKDGEKLFFKLQDFVAGFVRMKGRAEDNNGKYSEGFLNKELEYLEVLSTAFPENFLVILRKMALANAEARLTASNKEPLFTVEAISELKKTKLEIKESMSEYTKLIKKLKQCEMACLKSKAKEEKYQAMFEAAEKADQHTDDVKRNKAMQKAVKTITKGLNSKQEKHLHNTERYLTALNREAVIRCEMEEKSQAIKKEVTETIKLNMQKSLHDREDVDLDTISQCIYNLITRTYTLYIPPSVDDTTQRVHQADVMERVYSRHNIKRILSAVDHYEKVTSLIPEPAAVENSAGEDTDVNTDDKFPSANPEPVVVENSDDGNAEPETAKQADDKMNDKLEKKGFFVFLIRWFGNK